VSHWCLLSFRILKVVFIMILLSVLLLNIQSHSYPLYVLCFSPLEAGRKF
jgi:hypothetical protein